MHDAELSRQHDESDDLNSQGHRRRSVATSGLDKGAGASHTTSWRPRQTLLLRESVTLVRGQRLSHRDPARDNRAQESEAEQPDRPRPHPAPVKQRRPMSDGAESSDE